MEIDERLKIALRKFGVEELLNRHSSAKEELTRDNILFTIFYSSRMEGNLLEPDAAKALINGNLVVDGGRPNRFIDYIELANSKDVCERLMKHHGAMTKDYLVEIHAGLFNNLLSQYTGTRRSITSVEMFLTGKADRVDSGLDVAVALLNTEPNSKLDAFLTAAQFHLEYAMTHPFEDGNGRTARLLMNQYLMKNGLSPLVIEEEEKRIYFSSLRQYHSSGYSLSAIMALLYFYLRPERDDLIELSKLGRAHNRGEPLILAIADTILAYNSIYAKLPSPTKSKSGDSGNAERIQMNELLSDILYLYTIPEFKSSAIALTYIADPPYDSVASIINDGLHDVHEEVRQLAIRASTNLTSQDYAARVKAVAYELMNDESVDVRASAVYTLVVHSDSLSKTMIQKMLQDSNDEPVRLQTLLALSHSTRYRDSIDLIQPLLHHSSLDVSYLAIEAFIMNAAIEDIPRYLGDTRRLNGRLKEAILKTLKRPAHNQDKIGQPSMETAIIADWLCKNATEDREMTDCILYYLSKEPYRNKSYARLAHDVLKSQDYNTTEKAYAAYVLGKMSVYYPELSSELPEIKNDNPEIMNMALFLSQKHEKVDGMEPIFNLNNKSVHIIASIELSRLIDGNAFGRDFLFLCKKELRGW